MKNTYIKHHINQKGSVLPFIAICLVLIMSMLAFVFDFGAMVTTKSDLRDSARAAAISSLKAYIQHLNTEIENGADPNNAATYMASAEIARTTASAVTNLNLSVSASSLLRDGETTEHSQLANSQLESDSGGFVQFGRWHFIEPDDGTRPVCSPEPEPFRPCFEDQGDSVAANAIRVTLTDQNNRVRSIFRTAAGFSGVHTVGDFGTAAFVPRQGVVAFDLSGSVTRSSHLSSDSGDIKKSEYAFYLDPSNGVALNCDGDAWRDNLDATMQERHLDTWTNLDESRADAGVSLDELNHFRDDFDCIKVNLDNADGPEDEYFIIEKSQAADGTPLDVQPLNSILDATNFLLEEFASRRVVGDRVGAFGFDAEVISERRLPRNPNSNGILLAQPVTGSDGVENEFDSFLNATNTSIDITDPVRKDRFLFPRIFTGHPGELDRQIATTDIQLALDESIEMLQSAETFEISDNFVLLITDGLTNCVQDPVNAPIENNIDRDNPIMCFNTNEPNGQILNQQFIEAGFNEILNINPELEFADDTTLTLSERLANEGVRLHIALIGDHVSPHTLVRKSQNESGCMSFEEANASGLPTTNSPVSGVITNASGNPVNLSPGHLSFPNNFSSVASATGGQWWPIIRPCETLTQDRLNEICDEQAEGDTTQIAPPDPNEFPNTEWDAQGRLLCNPSGQSTQEQLENLINQIMSDSPIVIVE